MVIRDAARKADVHAKRSEISDTDVRVADFPDRCTGSISYRPGHQLTAISSLHRSAISRNRTFKATENPKTQTGRSPHRLSMSHMRTKQPFAAVAKLLVNEADLHSMVLTFAAPSANRVRALGFAANHIAQPDQRRLGKNLESADDRSHQRSLVRMSNGRVDVCSGLPMRISSPDWERIVHGLKS